MVQEAKPLLVLVATMTGTAEVLAEDLQSEFEDACAFRIQLLEDTEVETLEQEDLVLVVSSTYGTGDVPETAAPALEALRSDRPDLRGLSYGVIALGDGSYVNTFAQGGEHWDRALADCGARRVGEPLKIDCLATENPLEPAKAWFAEWLGPAISMHAGETTGGPCENAGC